jgi:tetratricopeptide (TPR) repeat protein
MHVDSYLQWGRNLWDRLEERHIAFRTFLVLFLSIVTLRNLLESFSSTGYIEQFATYTLHYPLAFVISFLMLTILLSALSTERIEKVSRLMFYLWLLILLPPLVDICLAAARAGERKAIGWLKYEPGSFWWTYLNLYNPFVKLKGATVGIRLQSLLSCVLAAVYVYVKSRSALRTLLTPFVISFFSFCFFSLPTLFVSLSSLLNPAVVDAESMIFTEDNLFRNLTQRAATSMAAYQLFLAFFLSLVWLVLHDRRRFLATLTLLDWKAYGHSLLSAAFGFVLGWRMFLPSMSFTELAGNHRDLAAIKAVALCLWGVVLFRSSLVQGSGEKGEAMEGGSRAYALWDVMVVSLLMTISFASVTSYPVLVWALAMLILETVSYLSPFRAASVPVVSAVAGAARAFVPCLLGYSLFAGNLAPTLFPGHIAAALLLLFFFVHLISPLVKKRHLVMDASYLIAFAVLTYALWPRMPELGTKVRHSPRELTHSIFATFLEHDGLEDHALLELEKAYALGSEDPWIAHKLGIASYGAGDRGKALSYYRRALELDPGYTQALNNIVILLTEMGRGEEAGDYVKRLLETNDESGLSLANAATYFIARRESGEGLRRVLALGEPLRNEPGRDAVLRLLLSVLEETSPGDLEDHLETARAKPADSVAQLRAGVSLQKSGRLREALVFYQRALEAAPTLGALHFITGSAYQAMGEHERAVAEYRRFLTDYPGNLEGSINLGASLLEMGKTRDALLLLERLAEKYPREPRLAVNIANAYMKQGNMGEAERRFRALIDAGSDEALVHYNLAVLLEREGRLKEALPHFEEAGRRGLRSPVLFTKLGQFRESAGDREGALQMYSEAVRADSGFAPALQGIARIRGKGEEGDRKGEGP